MFKEWNEAHLLPAAFHSIPSVDMNRFIIRLVVPAFPCGLCGFLGYGLIVPLSKMLHKNENGPGNTSNFETVSHTHTPLWPLWIDVIETRNGSRPWTQSVQKENPPQTSFGNSAIGRSG